ncbi:MAG: hypothetical protein U0V74_03635 [Chitinophagales bacterium]
MDAKDRTTELNKEILTAFNEQFALVQHQNQTVFIQVLSAAAVVFTGFAFILTNVTTQAEVFNAIRDSKGVIVSYSLIQLIFAYGVLQAILVALTALILNIGYSYRRDQRVVYNIRKKLLGNDFEKIFGTKNYKGHDKGPFRFLPNFNFVLFNSMLLLQLGAVIILFVVLGWAQNEVAERIWIKVPLYALIIAPPLISLTFYFDYYYNKYVKNVRNL